MHDKSVVIPVILKGLSEGLPEYQAAKNAGVEWSTFWIWKDQDPALSLRVEEAKRSRVGIIEDALYKSAMKGNVTACLTLLRKESRQWRELLDGSIVPNNPQDASRLTNAAAAGAAAVLGMLAGDKREKLRAAMRREGMIIDVNQALPDPHHKNGNGTNGNGASHS